METERRATIALLARVQEKDSVQLRFQECGSNPRVFWSPSRKRYSLRGRTCGHRWCPVCSRRRAAQIRVKLERMMRSRRKARWRFITLTIVSVDRPLKQTMKHLTDSFAKLRRFQLWQELVIGGAAVMEVKIGKNSGLWHAHLHMLVHGAYIPQARLSAAWFKASKGSPVVDIRPVKSQEKAAAYLAKYLAKDVLCGDSALPENRQDEYYKSMKGARLLRAFGDITAEDWDDENAPTDEGVDDWVDVGFAADIQARAAAGDAAAKAIIDAILTPKHEFPLLPSASSPP